MYSCTTVFMSIGLECFRGFFVQVLLHLTFRAIGYCCVPVNIKLVSFVSGSLTSCLLDL